MEQQTTTTHYQTLMNKGVELMDNHKRTRDDDISFEKNKKKKTTLLDPLKYETWTSDQVFSLLSTPKENGGAGFSEELATLLHNAKFNGSSIFVIVMAIQTNKNVVEEAVKILENVPSKAISVAVYWVSTLLKTNLYQFWTNKYLREQLCVPSMIGGAGLTEESIPSMIDGPLLMKVKLKALHIQEPSLQKQIENLLQILYNVTLLTIDTPYPKNTPKNSRPNLIDLLDGMTKLEISPLKYNFVNQNMKYVQRKDALNTYLDYITHNFNGNDIKSGGASILFIGASPGVGKTRFALELPNYLKEYYSNTPKFLNKNIKMVHLAIWFSGGASLDPKEVDSNKKPLNLEQSIVARMIYSYIVHINPHSWYGHHVAIQNIIDLSLLMTIYESLDNINNLIFDFFTWLGNKEQEEGKTLWIHFTLDEYNQLLPSDRETTDEEDSKFHNILDMLSTIRHTLPGIFTNLLSGTHMHNLSKNFVHGGRVYVKRIELLNFDRNEQEEMYLKQNYPLSIAKKSLFYSLGGHARLIELFGQKKDDSVEEIIKHLDECTGIYPGAIRIGLELDKSTLEILISLCISQKSIEFDTKINGKTLKQLQRSMILFIQDSHVEERTVHIPIIILLKLIKTLIRLEDDHTTRKSSFITQQLEVISIKTIAIIYQR